MLNKSLFLTLLFLVALLGACSTQTLDQLDPLQPEPFQEEFAELTLQVTDWLGDTNAQELKSFAKNGQKPEISLEIQDASGKLISFNASNQQSESGQKTSFSLDPETPSILLKVKPGSYLISTHQAGKTMPNRTLETLGTGAYEVNLDAVNAISVSTSTTASDSTDSNLAEPVAPTTELIAPYYLEANLYAYAQITSIEEGYRLKLEGLDLTIQGSDETFYFDESAPLADNTTFIGGIPAGLSAQDFWENLTSGQAVAVDGVLKEGVLQAHSIVRIPDESATESGYLGMLGKITALDSNLKTLQIEDFGSLSANISNEASYHSDYETLDEATFWQRAAEGRFVMLDGRLDKDGFKAENVYLPSVGAEIPPLPDYLEGEIVELNKDARTLRFQNSEGTLVRVTSDTFYFSDSLGYDSFDEDNNNAETFWNELSLGDYLYVEGNLEGSTLTANSMYSMGIPMDYLDGTVAQLNRQAKELRIQSWEDLAIVVSTETSYYEDQAFEFKQVESEQFWQELELNDYLYMLGTFSDDEQSFEALEITKSLGVDNVVFGTLQSYDQASGLLVISGYGYQAELDSNSSTTTTVSQPVSTEPVLPPPPNVETTVQVNANTKFILNYREEMSSEDFWERLEPNSYISAEGSFEGDLFQANVINLDNYETFDYLEGTLATADETQEFIILSEAPEVKVDLTEANFYNELGSIDAEQFWAELEDGSYLVVEGKIENNTFTAVSVFILVDGMPIGVPLPEPTGPINFGN